MEITYEYYKRLHEDYFLLVRAKQWVPKWQWNIAHQDFLRTDKWRELRIIRYSLSQKKCDCCNDYTPLEKGECHHWGYHVPFGEEIPEIHLGWLCKKCHSIEHDDRK